MSEPEVNIDPSIFDKDNELAFSFALCGTAQDYTVATDLITRYESENSAEARAGLSRELREDPAVKVHIDNITNILGDSMNGLIENILIGRVDGQADKAAYESALATRSESCELLVGYVFGYQSYMEGNLLAVFDGEINEALLASWSATWTKLRDTLHPLGGTMLAEVADFFDDIIHWKYDDTYDHTDKSRGPMVSQDISARTFYEIMEQHLTRSIVRRQDGWSS